MNSHLFQVQGAALHVLEAACFSKGMVTAHVVYHLLRVSSLDQEQSHACTSILDPNHVFENGAHRSVLAWRTRAFRRLECVEQLGSSPMLIGVFRVGTGTRDA